MMYSGQKVLIHPLHSQVSVLKAGRKPQLQHRTGYQKHETRRNLFPGLLLIRTRCPHTTSKATLWMKAPSKTGHCWRVPVGRGTSPSPRPARRRPTPSPRSPPGPPPLPPPPRKGGGGPGPRFQGGSRPGQSRTWETTRASSTGAAAGLSAHADGS